MDSSVSAKDEIWFQTHYTYLTKLCGIISQKTLRGLHSYHYKNALYHRENLLMFDDNYLQFSDMYVRLSTTKKCVLCNHMDLIPSTKIKNKITNNVF